MNTGKIDENFGKIMRKMRVQFAKTGDPSLPADISSDGKAYEWPLYDLENEQVMVFANIIRNYNCQNRYYVRQAKFFAVRCRILRANV